MKLKEYIKKVLDQTDGEDVDFELCLNEIGDVSYDETGNKIKFKTCKKLNAQTD